MTAAADASVGQASPPQARAILFCAILLVGWISFQPFVDLGSPENLELADGRDVPIYIAFALMAPAAAFLVWRTDRPALKCLLTPTYVGLAAWMGVTLLTSQGFAVSIKRVAIVACACACSLSLFLLPRDRAELARLLSFVALFIVGLSYLGLVFAPQYSIHQLTDLGEPQLAGDWRGLYGHKNTASAMFSILAFIGVFVLRVGRAAEGWIILVLSVVFIFASGGKSSTAIFLVTVALSFAATHLRNPLLWSLVVFSPLAALNLIGVGSILWPQIGALTSGLMQDSTFTGRADIWAFAIPKTLETPIFGHGVGAFWATEALRYGMEQNTMWAGGAAHAHNGYLDAVVSMGLPGLVLMAAAFIVQPALDVRRACARGDEPALATLFMQIWMFSLYLNSLESFFFDRANPSWIAFLFAIFGMRYLAEFKVLR